MMQFNVSSTERDYETDYDVIIIGAGAAGYSAGVYIKRSGMSVAILERESVPGGNTAVSPLVENYLGFNAIEGADLAEVFRKHYAQYGKIITEIDVRDIKKDGEKFKIITNRSEFTARAVIVTTGTTHRKTNVKGEDESMPVKFHTYVFKEGCLWDYPDIYKNPVKIHRFFLLWKTILGSMP